MECDVSLFLSFGYLLALAVYFYRIDDTEDGSLDILFFRLGINEWDNNEFVKSSKMKVKVETTASNLS